MKLCRFELAEESGVARSGFAYEGRIIETDGTQAVQTYQGSDVRLLAPIGRPNSVRVLGLRETSFQYAHPLSMLGPNQTVTPLVPNQELAYVPCIAVVLVGHGGNVPVHRADDLVMGLSFAHCFRYRDRDGGGAFDVGFALGPAIVTPDEFEAGAFRPENGKAYEDTVTLLQNSIEVGRFELDALEPTVAHAISFASSTMPVAEGDVIVIPLGDPESEVASGDEFRLTSERMGTLIVRLA